MNIEDPVWNHSTFSFNRDRLFDAEVAQRFFENTVLLARLQSLVSDEHFSVDGTLLEACASHKSFRPKDGNDEGGGSDFRGEKRSNESVLRRPTRCATDAQGQGSGSEVELSGQCADGESQRIADWHRCAHATGTGDRNGALALVDARLKRGSTLGADKGYDVHDFVGQLKARGIQAHIARNTNDRRSAIDGRKARSKAYAMSQQARKRIEQGFGWVKTIGGLCKLPMTTLPRVRVGRRGPSRRTT